MMLVQAFPALISSLQELCLYYSPWSYLEAVGFADRCYPLVNIEEILHSNYTASAISTRRESAYPVSRPRRRVHGPLIN